MLRQIFEAVLIEKDDPDSNDSINDLNGGIGMSLAQEREVNHHLTTSNRLFVTTTVRPDEGSETSHAKRLSNYSFYCVDVLLCVQK